MNMAYDNEEEEEEEDYDDGLGAGRGNGAAAPIEPENIKPSIEESNGEVRSVCDISTSTES